MTSTYCPACDCRLSSAELTEGWCENCGKKLPVSLAARAARKSPRSATAPKGEPTSLGQAMMIGLFCLAVLVVIGGALDGDPKSIRTIVKIGGMLTASLAIAGLRGLWGLVRGNAD